MGEWRLALTAERKSPQTIALYLDSVDPLTVAQVRALLQTRQFDGLVEPETPPLRHVRNEAIIRLMAETGIRLSDRHSATPTGPELWLGARGRGLAADALYRSLRRRAERAGIDGFRPHRLRHTAAHRWLAAGGSEFGLMAMAGGPASRCSSATPEPTPANALPSRPAVSISETSDPMSCGRS